MSMKFCFRFFISLSLFSTLVGEAQNSMFISSDPDKPIIKRGNKLVRMNQFTSHLVMYMKPMTQGDSLHFLITDSLRYDADTLYIRLCQSGSKFCGDSLAPPGELFEIIHGRRWLKIPASRLHRIKSKKQPLDNIMQTISIVSYATFVTGLWVLTVNKNDRDENLAREILVFFPVTITSWMMNEWLAKKRFKFHSFTRYRVRYPVF
jgi:hypothetical protein